VEEVNSIGRSLLSFVSHYQHEGKALDAWAGAPQQWMDWGPTHTTCVVACIPAFTDESGHSTGARPVAAAGTSWTQVHVCGWVQLVRAMLLLTRSDAVSPVFDILRAL